MKNEITLKVWTLMLGLTVSFVLGRVSQGHNKLRYVKLIDEQFEVMGKMQAVNNRCINQVIALMEEKNVR